MHKMKRNKRTIISYNEKRNLRAWLIERVGHVGCMLARSRAIACVSLKCLEFLTILLTCNATTTR